jgi:hypothetical protein
MVKGENTGVGGKGSGVSRPASAHPALHSGVFVRYWKVRVKIFLIGTKLPISLKTNRRGERISETKLPFHGLDSSEAGEDPEGKRTVQHAPGGRLDRRRRRLRFRSREPRLLGALDAGDGEPGGDSGGTPLRNKANDLNCGRKSSPYGFGLRDQTAFLPPAGSRNPNRCCSFRKPEI